MSNPTSPRTLKTVDTASAVLEGLVELDGAGVTELADHLDVSKSTAYTYLKSLEGQEFVSKRGDTYRLSYRFLLLGEYVRNDSLLYRFGRGEVDRVAEELGHYAHLVVEEYGRGVSIYEAKGESAADYEYQETKLQRPSPLHVTASGKAILSQLPEERVDEVVDEHGLERWTEHTITEDAALREELETVRERGFAYNDEEEIEGFRAVAAPVCGADGSVLGAVTVSGPTSFLDDESLRTGLPEHVTTAATNVEVSINMMRRNSDVRDR